MLLSAFRSRPPHSLRLKLFTRTWARQLQQSKRHLDPVYSRGSPRARDMAEEIGREGLALAGQIRLVPDSEVELRDSKRPRVGGDDTEIPMDSKPDRKDTPNLKGSKRRSKVKRPALPEPCSVEDILYRDIVSILGLDAVSQASEAGTEYNSPFAFREEVVVEVKGLSPGGEGIAIPTEEEKQKTPWAIIVPFVLPGEIVRARVYRHARLHSYADLLEVITPNLEMRDNHRVRCKYFGKCGGCQYQMLDYETQLNLKREVIIKAYKNFSRLPDGVIPPIQPTIGSPLQYGYRTKITPHFEAAPKSVFKRRQQEGVQEETTEQPDWLKIGFNVIGTRKVMDIEECPIATSVINEGLVSERERIIKNAYSFKKGASLILRDSLDPKVPIPQNKTEMDALANALNKHVCVTSHKATIREKVGNLYFEYSASSFFQNNNSVLVPLTQYVKDAIFLNLQETKSTTPEEKPTHLVDTYCGAGLFALTLSPYFNNVAGIELSTSSISSAKHNITLNDLTNSPTSPNISFRAGDAADLFASVRADFPSDKTVVVVDPPRKGCDEAFIKQLVSFRPSTVVYVSCNVHTQARDVGQILKISENEDRSRGRYVLESLRGFDLFPQTAHVESVAVLRLKRD